MDWLWFGELGFRSMFSTVLLTRLVVIGPAAGGLLAPSTVIAYHPSARPRI